MKTRVLTINLATPLRAELKERSSLDLAKRIGISPQKLTAIINDEWSYITRDAIERTADYLKVAVADVFELVPVEFWRPIEEAGQCTFLRGSQVEKANGQDIHIPGADTDATSEVTSFLRGFMSGFTYADHKRDKEELINRAKSENCIVIGSVRSNAATEILLSCFFGAEPFDASDDNRFKIPFGFCWPEDASSLIEPSSLSCSDKARKRTKNQSGISAKGGPFVPADYKDLKSFREESTERGRDCGLVFVANRPFQIRT